jgi:hypothetical protein
MKKLKTLYLTRTGFDSGMIKTDTILRGLFRQESGAKPPAVLANIPAVQRLYSRLYDHYTNLGYIIDWMEAFVQHPALDVEVCNINNLVYVLQVARRMAQYDLVIVSHAATGDAMTLITRLTSILNRRCCPLVVFVGNEYSLLDEKIAFIKNANASWVCTQLSLAAGQYLYGEAVPVERVICLPHALNPNQYYPLPHIVRDRDVVFRGALYPPSIGDNARNRLIENLKANAEQYRLSVDIGYDKMDREDWHRLLASGLATVGGEAGTYYLNDRGDLFNRAQQYCDEHPDANFDEVFDRFYVNVVPTVSGKTLSSRHFEAIGTQTAQLLIEGDYLGILHPDVHYIPVKPDLSNVDEALQKLRDNSYRQQMVSQTHRYVLAQHTHRHRVDKLLEIL